MLYNAPTGSTDPNAPYVGKNVGAGQQGSKIPPAMPEHTQREIVAAIVAAGLTPSGSDLQQLLRAVRGGKLQYFVDTSTSAGAPAIAPDPAHTSLFDGLFVRVKMKFASNGATSLTVNGLSAPIKRMGNVALVGGEWAANDIVGLVYSATANAFQIQGLTASDVLSIPRTLLVPVFWETAGTYSWIATSNAIDLEVIGAGGGGGGSTNIYAGASGGEGGRSFKRVTGLTIGQAYTIIVGAGGSAPAAGGTANGGTGGSSSAFGVSCLGGTGGLANTGSACSGGLGGTASGGDRNYQGQCGQTSSGPIGYSNYAVGGGGGGNPRGLTGSEVATKPGSGGGGGFSTAPAGAGKDGGVYIRPL